MAYEYDRFEREDHGGAFLMGLLAGTVLGAGLGMLFAPKAGNELRTQLADSANRLQRTAADTYQQASEKMNEVVSKGRDTVNEVVSKGRENYEQILHRGRDAFEKGREAYQETREPARNEPQHFGTGMGPTGNTGYGSTPGVTS
jgi:gas vesicle protein